MHIHILGIGGTFMGSCALLARELGHRVTGSDGKIWPPMSTQLENAGIALMEGYRAENLEPTPDLVLIGNVLSRGNAELEAVLDRGLRYTSGAQWVADAVLAGRWTLAVAGTHGKTTTTSMLAWILEYAGLKPGFLIGGVPENFGVSARLGDAPFFVIEADEYDTAFFDKRSKFVHYRPRTLIVNNIEFDHADIFPDLDSIKRQFHHVIRTVPKSGLVVANGADANVAATLAQGCWTPVEYFDGGDGWQADLLDAAGTSFRVSLAGRPFGIAQWSLAGRHNVSNALAAIAAARHAGVPVETSLAALAEFRNVKRRLEVRGTVRGVTVYDDFAHHPTAIRLTLAALRAQAGTQRILAVLEPRSNTMRMGVHSEELADVFGDADAAFWLRPPELKWDLDAVAARARPRARVFATVEEIVATLAREARSGDRILIMSNGGFENIHARLLAALGTAGDRNAGSTVSASKAAR
jgi:UDP-N-acetylmuramate: L-alanyl-gamma-D-glutamyl-meso-diaminopimelate ligase